MICILSDFGTESIYTAEMIGVIKSINPKAEVLILKNNITRHNILEGAFIINEISKYFPPGTIFLCVVDPTVGSSRPSIILVTKRNIYVGPDNGLFYYVAKNEGILSIYKIEISKIFDNISMTFHGRDVFAKVAAMLDMGFRPDFFGTLVNYITESEIEKPLIINESVLGKIIYIDDFGNLITNISKNDLIKANLATVSQLKVNINNVEYKLPFVRTYSEVSVGSPLILINSFNLVELAINQGDAKKFFKVNVNDYLQISKV
ncbi:MAG: SAM-dependent chlorinase/fluorinase [Thermoproteota archaeon]|nr:SAM-dependent chlorinase/fluorinase [Thermoproteota archaeon]